MKRFSQFLEERSWIKGFINYKVGIDGISILFVILTTFIAPLCVVSVNNNVKNSLIPNNNYRILFMLYNIHTLFQYKIMRTIF